MLLLITFALHNAQESKKHGLQWLVQGENGHLILEVFEIGSFNTQVLLAHIYSSTNS